MKVKESAENYLETILILKQEMGNVRSIDVAHHLGFTKPSISRAMSLLRQENLVTVDEEGFLNLTDSGQEIADRVYERHQLLTSWLTGLGVSYETASEDACRIEHVISQETFKAIKAHIHLKEG